MAASGLSPFAVLLMVLLAIQVGLQPILAREFTGAAVSSTSAILACEVSKFILSSWFLWYGKQFGQALRGWSLWSSFKAAGLPAVIYAIQNTCTQLAYRHLDGLTFNLLNQTKTMFAAVCVYLLMGKPQSKLQIVALAGLLLASAVLAVGSDTSAGHHDLPAGSAPEYGIALVLFASLLSGLAAALSQKSLQKEQRNSFLFTMELAVFSSISLLVSLVWSADGQAMARDGLLHGWTLFTLLPVVLQAFGGIIVGLVMKHAGGVQKGFAIMGGILLSGMFQLVLFGQPLSTSSWVALPLVLGSTWLHVASPPAEKSAPKKAE